MNSEHHPEDQELDAQLARLPQWQPPADFSARLAAAAARQASEPLAAPVSTRAWLWQRCVQQLPLTLGAILVATVLALVPWVELVANPLFFWLIAGAAATSGVALTLRLLRAP